MMKYFRIVYNLGLIVAAVFFWGGCMSFDYVGQHFTARPESAAVAIFNGRSEIPADSYRIIGRGTLRGPVKIDSYDRIVKLKEKARSCGADALCIVAETQREVGLYPRSDGEFASPLSVSSNKINLDDKGVPWSNDSFDERPVTMAGEQKARIEFEMKVLFLKKRSDLDSELKKHSGKN